MSQSEIRPVLPLASSAAGCSCCSSEPSSSRAGAGAVGYTLKGLTCGHCVRTVEKAVSALDGVAAASVELVPGGRARLVVDGEVAASAIREAVSSAGYALVQ
ncbi:heavy-metal-associated domain-containing protein [Paenarthrobacter nitroguajacolicus]|uniref:heavy-metal-associated domain-containing protein n=1 Tax=Paenarthrobacter nitroguajacolicus TaxID=211146 RepID=UPI00248D1DD2|nr:heavy-metal-associated domain-containing protein [Paenarthrobacter nitroguajacolicus]MDI2036419.1 hypothetical protein [Paenarthrobacter nitroguajacolicus]